MRLELHKSPLLCLGGFAELPDTAGCFWIQRVAFHHLQKISGYMNSAMKNIIVSELRH